MKARILLAVAVIVGATAFAPVPFVKEKKPQVKDEDALQGVWVIKSRERAGGPPFKGLTSQQYVRIQGKNWQFGRDNGAGGFTFTGLTLTIRLDTSKSPAWLDLDRALPNGGFGKVKKGGAPNTPYYVGMVEVAGDTMRFVYTLRGERPADFRLTGPREMLITLERVKKP